MSKTTKRKYVVDEVLIPDLRLPQPNQTIVKIIASKGNNLHEVETGDGERYLMSMPQKFRKNMWVKRGDYVLVEDIEEGDRVKAEMVSILNIEYIKYFVDQGVWPNTFPVDKKAHPKSDYTNQDLIPGSDSDLDELEPNTNRLNTHSSSDTDNTTDEYEDDDENDDDLNRKFKD